MKKTIIIIAAAISALCASKASAQESVPEFYVLNQKTNRHDAIIYPNPTTERVVKIKATTMIKKVEIMSIIGKNTQGIENNLHIFDDLTINLEYKDPGVYLAKITFEDEQIIIKKLILK